MKSNELVGGEERLTHLIRIKEFGVKVQNTLQIKSTNIEQFLWRDLGVQTAQDGRSGVQLADLSLNFLQLGLIGQVCLVQKDLVSEAYLLHRLVLDSFGLLLGKPVENHFGVNHSDDRIQ